MTVDPAILLRFDEPADAVLPSDAAGNLADLNIDDPDTTMPPVVDAYCGFGRAFNGDDATGLMAQDAVTGATLLNRDITIQAILSWDYLGQAAAGTPGSIIYRGLGSGSASEYWAYGLDLRVANEDARIGELRWRWQTVAGAIKTQVGGQFAMPVTGADGFLLLTATRRWISSTEVELAYYVGDTLLARLTSSDGDIGGGTTGTTTVGANQEGGVWGGFLWGTIDEIRVVEEALTHEEITATWQRIAVIQPQAVQLVLETQPPGFPVSDEPASRVQRENRGIGHALGYAAAQVENVRANLMPDRAYARALERWEVITGQHPRPGDSVARRRDRVVAHLRQHAGFAPAAVRLALRELYGLVVDDIALLAFTNTIVDAQPFGTRRWRAYGAGAWSLQSGAARGQSSVDEDIRMTNAVRSWAQYAMALQAKGRGFDGIVKLIPTAIADGTEAGIFAENRATGNRIMIGLRNVAGSYKVYRSHFVANALVSETLIATESLTTMWLRLHMSNWIAPGTTAAFDFQYSLTSGLTGFAGSTAVAIDNSAGEGLNRFGFYVRDPSEATSTHGAVDVRFDDVNLREPYGLRPFHVYAYRDPARPGAYDLIGANLLLRRARQAHIHAAAIDSYDVLYDHDGHGYDLGPLGAV